MTRLACSERNRYFQIVFHETIIVFCFARQRHPCFRESKNISASWGRHAARERLDDPILGANQIRRRGNCLGEFFRRELASGCRADDGSGRASSRRRLSGHLFRDELCEHFVGAILRRVVVPR